MKRDPSPVARSEVSSFFSLLKDIVRSFSLSEQSQDGVSSVVRLENLSRQVVIGDFTLFNQISRS